MEFKNFFKELEDNIENDWDDCGNTEREFFFELFRSQIRLWRKAGYSKEDSVESFKNEFPEMVQYYMDEYFRIYY